MIIKVKHLFKFRLKTTIPFQCYKKFRQKALCQKIEICPKKKTHPSTNIPLLSYRKSEQLIWPLIWTKLNRNTPQITLAIAGKPFSVIREYNMTCTFLTFPQKKKLCLRRKIISGSSFRLSLQ